MESPELSAAVMPSLEKLMLTPSFAESAADPEADASEALSSASEAASVFAEADAFWDSEAS